jgi:hypothetical protein
VIVTGAASPDQRLRLAGTQYAAYWTPQDVLQADAHCRAKHGGQ